jgi:EF hand domain-containing protein
MAMFSTRQKLQMIVTAGLLAAGVAGTAFAADIGFTTDYVRGISNKKMMGMMDSNKDHKVTKDEWMTFHEELFARIDKNGDGVITEEEWVSFGGAKSK